MIEQGNSEPEQSYFDSSEMPDDSSEAEAREQSYFQAPEREDAVRITGPAPEAVGDPTRYSRTVGEGNAALVFPAGTQAQAEASLEAIAAYCENCPISEHCPEEECAVYRAEASAEKVIEDAEGRTAVGGVVLPERYAT